MQNRYTISYLIFLGLTCVFLSICVAVLYGRLGAEKDRVYALADTLEVILNSTTNHDCKFDLSQLPASRLIFADEVTDQEALSIYPFGSRYFIYALHIDANRRRVLDEKYRGSVTTRQGIDIVTQKNGRLFTIGRSKP